MRAASLERWRHVFELMARRVDDDDWRHDLARSLRDAIGCAFVTVHGDTRRGQQLTWPFDWAPFMTGLRERFLPRIEAVGEGADYAIARFGRVYAPLEVARHAEIRAEMSRVMADADIHGYAVAFVGEGLDGLIAVGDDSPSPVLLDHIGPGLLGLAELARLHAPRPDPTALLTARERQIATLLAEGCSNLNVASHLDISEQTVAVHVRAIYRKLGVHSRVELARRWLVDR
jgi:DNA-binding CsgD family transcriptional regulator/acid stress-induced BolA-like protein IbaG/YrbA